jgi:hypothetical protein
MAWSGGYPMGDNPEGMVIPTGIIAVGDESRSGVFVASIGVSNWTFEGTPPGTGQVYLTFSTSAAVRWRRRWTSNGSTYVVDSTEELVIAASIVPVGVYDLISKVIVTGVRWSVWRLT